MKRSGNMFNNYFPDRVDGNALLHHAVTMADGNGMVFFGLVVDRYAERGSDGVHPAVTLADRVFFLVEAAKSGFAGFHDLPGDLRQTVFFGQGQHGQFDGSQPGRESQ